MLSISDKEFLRLVSHIKDNFGIDLTKKRTLIESRLHNTLSEKGYSDYTKFIDECFADPAGAQMINLINKLTTNHTFFMREPEHYEYLKRVILPFLETDKKNKKIFIWSAGCSSGEEAYTTAMLLQDYFGANKSAWDSRILATDISANVLKKAQDGIYKATGMRDLPSEWKRKFFKTIDNEQYQISPIIKNEVIFKTFNLMNDIPYKRNPFDLIFCRNVMIYFDSQTKIELVRRFYDVLRPGGYLFIGHSESITRETTKFDYIKPAIYRRPL